MSEKTTETATGEVSADAVMELVQQRVRGRLREQILRHGGSRAFEDERLFAEVEHVLYEASGFRDPKALILPQYLGDPADWRLDIAMRYKTHRSGFPARALVFAKQRLLMPVLRWLFEYSRDNFERQQRLNHVLIACVQELAIETARLRGDVRRLSGSADTAAHPDAAAGER